jgi:hypothetical protein
MSIKALLTLTLTLSLLTAAPLSLLAAEVTSPSPPSSTTAASAETQTNPIHITLTQLDETDQQFSSRWLRKKYDTYTVIIQNMGKTPVQILSADIPERLAPEDVYTRMKHSAAKRYATTAGMGLVTAPLTFGISLVACLLLLGPIDAIGTGSYNQSMLKYVSRFPGKIPFDLLPAGETRQVNVLTAYNVKPHLYLRVQDLLSKDVFPVQNTP